MPLSTIFQLYRVSQLYWWRKPEYPEKTTDLPQVTDKINAILNVIDLLKYHLFSHFSGLNNKHPKKASESSKFYADPSFNTEVECGKKSLGHKLEESDVKEDNVSCKF